jgi:eukaryotic-like serine/threonine-protein kinase
MDTTLAGQPAGQLLDGRYRVTSSIATGGMATVYMGVDVRLDRPVAVKIMHAELAADQDFVARFIREARSIAQLSHPNVVAVYDQGSDGHHLYLAMEYVAGPTLRQLLNERGKLSPGESLDIIESVLAGLAAAHQAGIVHRDVKPENVLLAVDGRVKVADFGLARSMSGTSHTKTGVLMGTVAYLAPEQVTDNVSDARCDVYAAGVMLFELLTGHQPHTGESALAVAYKHVNETVPPPSAVTAGLAPVLDDLVALSTSRDPALRPADAGQFLEAVSQVRKGLPIPWQPQLQQAQFQQAQLQQAQLQQAQFHDPYQGQAPGAPGMPPGIAGPPFGREDFPGNTGQQGAAPSAHPQQNQSVIPGFPPEPGGTRSAAMYGQGNQTLIVATGGAPELPPREPRLQRWLFSRRLAYLLVFIVVAALVAGLGWWQLEGKYTDVPRVSGLSVASAGNELRGMGFTVRTGPARLDNSLAKGEVMTTVPAAAARVRKGATVELIVSAGPRLLGVPQVSGQTLAAAQAALRQAGLTPGAVVSQVSATIAAGIVISTDPGVGTFQPQPQPVKIMVSAGPPLPNLVGQQEAAAQQWAAANGVSLNEQPGPANSTQPQGTIVRQSPAPNTPVTKGEVVTVYVSPGPPNVAIPNVDGMGLAKAAQTLQALGFQVTSQQSGPFGRTVFNYSPSGQAPKGSTITLYYGLPNL